MTLSEEAFKEGLYPKCFSPDSFVRETLSQRLEKAQKGSNLFSSEPAWTTAENEALLQGLNRCSSDNLQPLFDSLPNRSPEELIYHYLNLPFEDITSLDIFRPVQSPRGRPCLTIDQREAINSLIAQDPTVFDDYDNPVIQHAAIFKMSLDKVKEEQTKDNKDGKEQTNKETTDNKTQQASSSGIDAEEPQEEKKKEPEFLQMTPEEKELILELESSLRASSAEASLAHSERLSTDLKSMIDILLTNLCMKVSFIDEYEKYVYNQDTLNRDILWSHLTVEAIKDGGQVKVTR